MAEFKGLISADWNECLAPCGPFDCIGFHHPHLRSMLNTVFRAYTANRSSLAEVLKTIQDELPAAISSDQMDNYLAHSWRIYDGVTKLIHWCSENRIAFMINTTGMLGYFQRAFFARLLPPIEGISAAPFIRYSKKDSDPDLVFPLFETSDKPKNTMAALQRLKIPVQKTVIMGDSGGDGPHFEWGASVGALLIGCQPKNSLEQYCSKRGITISHRMDATVSGDETDRQSGFMSLTGLLTNFLA